MDFTGQLVLVCLFRIQYKNRMRPSAVKTTSAALRLEIDALLRNSDQPPLGQKGFAELLGKSVSTIQSLETGRLALSDETAKLICLETGASPGWLLDGKPGKPKGVGGSPFTLEAFERCRMLREKQKAQWRPDYQHPDLSDEDLEAGRELAGRVVANCIAADQLCDLCRELADKAIDHPDADFRIWKLMRALERLRAEFEA